MTKLQGSWIWYELVTPDPAAAKAFYEPVVGWTLQAGTAETGGYGFIISPDGAMSGGVLPLTAEMQAGGARPGWLGYIGVDDCDAAVAEIETAGGRCLMPPRDIAMAGRIALIADPGGALFYVMTPSPPPGGGVSTAFSPELPGHCGWNELHAADAAKAIAFYTDRFAWTLGGAMDMGEHGTYQFIEHDGVGIGAIMGCMAGAPPRWNHYFLVPSIAGAVAVATERGAQIVHGPMEVPGGQWMVQAIDPQGTFFCLAGGK